MIDMALIPILALDVGDVRIGVAISRSGVIAEPLETLERIGRRQILDAIEAVVVREGAKTCVLGLPRLESGAEGEQAEKTRAFGRSLARRIPRLRIEFFDERYSSAEAAAIAGRRAGGQRGIIDRFAAALILEGWLAARALEEQNAAPDAARPLAGEERCGVEGA